MKYIAAMYLFSYCVFYDYFKYPSNFNGMLYNSVDLLQMATLMAIPSFSVGMLLKRGLVRADSLVVLTGASVYAVTWAIAVLSYNASFLPSTAIDATVARASELDELLKIAKFFAAYVFLPYLLAKFLSDNLFAKVIYGAAFVHVAWAVHQMLYFWGVVPVEILPIQVGGRIDSFTFNYVYGRGSGLLTNPFNFAFFIQLAALLALFRSSLLKSRNEFILFFVFASASLLSLNRTTLVLWFVFCSFMFLSSKKGSNKIRITLLLASIVLLSGILIKWDEISLMIEKRLTGDVSMNTRLNGYMLAMDIAEKRPLFGAGFGHGIITDSTISTLIIESGLVGLFGWVLFWASVSYPAIKILDLSHIRGRENLVREASARALYWMVAFIFLGSFLVGSAERHPVLLSIMVLCFIVCNRGNSIRGLQRSHPNRVSVADIRTIAIDV